ncbi:MAG: hypothetical protein ACT4OO_10845, partial [Nitrospiraceae bacterium]
IHKQEQGAPYLVRVMVQARGTNQGITFFGMPPVQSVIIPFALPALTLYELRNQQGYARISLDIFDAASGRFIRSTPWKIGTTFYNQYTYLFFFFTRTTDLTPAP